ncbi:MAG: type II toxin-antitoxin system Phd/YefM family antitoxin [Chloroflexi bacterium]|nr:type II toxin-antitoxin system Phd/YefM family antitoxin [Chloroflexota bacterium]
MVTVGVSEAKAHFSRLLRRVATGEEIIITNRGRPVARLVPIGTPREREFGFDEGILTIPDDFDDPLPDEIQRLFEG